MCVAKKKDSNDAMLISIFENSVSCFSSEFKIFFFFFKFSAFHFNIVSAE